MACFLSGTSCSNIYTELVIRINYKTVLDIKVALKSIVSKQKCLDYIEKNDHLWTFFYILSNFSGANIFGPWKFV